MFYYFSFYIFYDRMFIYILVFYLSSLRSFFQIYDRCVYIMFSSINDLDENHKDLFVRVNI